MNLKTSKTIGIDISSDHISFAVVSEENGKLKLIKSGITQLPSGLIRNGMIFDQLLFVKTIKNVLGGIKVRSDKSIIALPDRSSLVQILDFPEEMPNNIRTYIGSEIKHCALFSGKSISFDFTGLKQPGNSSASRVFISATKEDMVIQFYNSLTKAGISPETMEPAVVGWIRSLYENKIKSEHNSNILLMLIRDDILNIAVFRDNVLDLIRSIDITEYKSDLKSFLDRVAYEINSVIQYYDIEFVSDKKNWKIIADFMSVKYEPESIKHELKNNLNMDISITSKATLKSDTIVEVPDNFENVSLTAVGLALYRHKVPGPNIKMDLIPDRLKHQRVLKKEALIYSCCTVLALTVIMLLSVFMGIRTTQASEKIDLFKQNGVLTKIKNLSKEIESTEKQIENLGQLNEFYSSVFDKSFEVEWASLLTDISQAAPRTLYLTEIQNSEYNKLEIHGNSYSSSPVYFFTEKLIEFQAIKSAEIQSFRKIPKSHSMIFSISCTLAD